MKQDPGLASWLQLSLAPGLTPSAFRGLLAEFGLPQEILAKKMSVLAAHIPPAALEAIHSDSVAAAVQRALAWALLPGHHVVTLADDAYPRALLEIPDPPAVL